MSSQSHPGKGKATWNPSSDPKMQFVAWTHLLIVLKPPCRPPPLPAASKTLCEGGKCCRCYQTVTRKFDCFRFLIVLKFGFVVVASVRVGIFWVIKQMFNLLDLCWWAGVHLHGTGMALLVPLLIFKKTLGLLKYFLIGGNSFAGTKVNWCTSMLSGGLSLMCLVIGGMIHHYQIVHFCLSGGSVAAQLPAFQLGGASHICL